MTQREQGLAILGKLVVFVHRPVGVKPRLVVSCDRDGMVELLGWEGSKFAPHLFAVATIEELARAVPET